MKGSITLKIDDSTLRAALAYAKSKGVDLSDVIEKFLLKFLSEKDKEVRDIQISDDVRALAGILASDENDKDWRERKGDYLKSKY